MTRFRIGLGLLAILLALGILTQSGLQHQQAPIVQALEQAADFALADNWHSARIEADRAATAWQKGWKITAALADHQPLEDIDGMLAQLEILARKEETADFAAACRDLARRMQAVADAHSLSWWNLL